MSRKQAGRWSMTVYLLHFVTPYHHARHYLGVARNLKSRLTQHAMGQGARLMEVITSAGIEWRLARTWRGDRQLERRLKDRKNSPLLCPICAGEIANTRATYGKGGRR